jgi:putative transposase
MSFRLIEAEKAQHPVSRLCTVLGVTRAGYYAWRRRGPSRHRLNDARLERLIVTIYDGSLQTYGGAADRGRAARRARCLRRPQAGRPGR